MAKQKTPEEKAEWAEKMKAARAAKKTATTAKKAEEEAAPVVDERPVEAVSEPVVEPEKAVVDDGKDAKIAMLEKQMAQLMAQLQAQQQPTVNYVVQDTEKVVLLWQAEVADDNIQAFGPNGMYGQVTGKSGKVIVPKSEWSRFYTTSVRSRIENRWLIVLSGMTDDERELYGCVYKPGELLDERTFAHIVEYKDELVGIFDQLCDAHKEFVATRFLDAWEKGKITNADRALVTKLNDMSKKTGAQTGDKYKKGLFWPIIEAMNAKDAE